VTAPVLDTPTGVLVGTFEPLSPEWFAARVNGIGGSEIAAVLGLSPWESRYSLWHRKQGRIPAQPEKPEMEAGKRLEDAICRKFADEHPELVIRRAGTYRHADRPWQIGNPDRLIYPAPDDHDRQVIVAAFPEHAATVGLRPAGILEAKLVLYPDEYGDPGTDQVPPYVLAQCRWYLNVLSLDVCYVQVFIGSSAQFREYVIRPDPADTATMLAAGQQFMNSIANGQRPDIDEHNETYEAIRQLHPDIDDVNVELDADLAKEYCTARHQLKAAGAEATRTKSLVADALGTSHRATFLDKTIAQRQAKDSGLPYLVAARNLPDFTEQEHTA
jgi:putative phage-type endonuclease